MNDQPVRPPQAQSWWLKLYRYLHVVRYQAYASLRAEISRTYLGVMWWLLEPTINALIMFFVFSFLFTNRSPSFLPFLLVGTFCFQWFSNGVVLASQSIIQKSGLMQQVYLPKVIFPLVSVINGTWKFFFAFLMLIVFLWFRHHPPNLAYLALPVIILVQFLFILAVALPLSCWTPYFRDATAVISSTLGLLSYLSGIFFQPSQVPESWREAFHLNPMAGLLICYRAVLLDAQWPDFHWLALCGAGSLLACFGGLLLTRHLDLELPKVANG